MKETKTTKPSPMPAPRPEMTFCVTPYGADSEKRYPETAFAWIDNDGFLEILDADTLLSPYAAIKFCKWLLERFDPK